MKIEFIYSDYPDTSEVPRTELFIRTLNLRDDILSPGDYRQRIITLATDLSRFTYSCLSLSCRSLNLKHFTIKAEQHSIQTHAQKYTIVLYFKNRSAKRGGHIQRLPILNPNQRIVNGSYHRVFANRSMVEGLIKPTAPWFYEGAEQAEAQVELFRIGSGFEDLLKHESNCDWVFQGVHGYWPVDLATSRRTTHIRREKEAQKEARAAERAARNEAEQVRKEKRVGHVYFIQMGEDGPIKIGYSLDPEKRLATLQTSSPEPLSLLVTIKGGKTLEKSLHDRFAAHHKRGEWYEPVPNLLAYIEALVEQE